MVFLNPQGQKETVSAVFSKQTKTTRVLSTTVVEEQTTELEFEQTVNEVGQVVTVSNSIQEINNQIPDTISVVDYLQEFSGVKP